MNEGRRKFFDMEKAGPYLCAFFMPVLVMCVVFLQRGFWPLGERCFLRTDLYHQYAPFFQELKNKIAHGGSLMYSWNIGGGTNFWALTAYYLASPLNILIALCPQSFIIEFITFMIVNKLGLCSLTVTWYLNKRHEKSGIAAYPAAFFGTFYALSGYMAAYQWNVMWLDCLWLFPLIILGLEQLVKEERGLLYCVALALTVFSNYYIAVMVCMGIACYCFFLLGTEPLMRRDFGRKLLKFIGYTLLGVGFSSVLLIPYIRYFSMTASANSTFQYEWYSYFSVFDMASRHLLAVEVHTGLDHWPNIYCGVMVFLGLPLYYLNRKITLREKLGYTALLLFFYFSFSTRAMDYIWHVFHIPNSLPCRQAFIYIFLLLVMCYRGFLGVEERTYRDLTFVMLAALIFVFMAEEFQTDDEYYQMYVFYGSAGFLLVYTCLLYLHRKGRVYKDVLIVLMLSLCCIENCINTGVTSVPTVRRSDYTCYDEGVRTIMAEIAEEEDGNFYRVEKTQNRTKNDGAWLGYQTISTFSSTANYRLTAFYKTLGLESSTNAYGSNGQTPFTNMLQGVKYSISSTALREDPALYTLCGTNDSNVYVYENRYTLPLGYVLDTDALLEWDNNGSTPLENQNSLAEAVSGIQSLFLDVTPNLSMAKEISIPVEVSGYYYAYSTKTGPSEIKVTHEDYSKTFEDLGRSYTMSIGWVEAGDTITFTNADSSSDRKIDVTLYLFQESLMDDVYQAFARNTMTVTSYDDTHVYAEVTVIEDGTLVTTIPFEDGWTVKVNGEETDYTDLKNAYLTLELSAGTYELEFSYRVPLIIPGAILTVTCGLVIALLIALEILKKRAEREALVYGPAPDQGFLNPVDAELPLTGNTDADTVPEGSAPPEAQVPGAEASPDPLKDLHIELPDELRE